MSEAIIRVGEGRGFIVQSSRERIVITAAHCLPFFPPCHSAAFAEERIYENLLGPLGEDPQVSAECLFADPIGDIAVLGPPDYQILSEAEKYEELTDGVGTLTVTDAPQNARVQLLSLDGRWFSCRARHRGAAFWLSEATEGIEGGMSGSPILDTDGRAIGVVCTAGGGLTGPHTSGGPNPRLFYNLPAGLLAEITES